MSPMGVLLLALLIPIAFILRQYFTIHYPRNLPRVCDEGRWRFRLRTRLRYYTDCQSLFRTAWERYSKHGKTCLVPGLGFRDEVILPASALKWATTQPDQVLNVVAAFEELDQVRYNVGHEKFVLDLWPGWLVKREMNAVLESLMVGLAEEVGVAFDRWFGVQEEWRDVKVLETMKMIVAQCSSRFTVGLPLCRKESYLKNCINFTDQFFITAGTIGACPKFLRPLLGPLMFQFQRINLRRMAKDFQPLLEARMEAYSNTPKSPDEPQDHLQMMIRYAQVNRPEELNLHDMTARLSMSNLGSFHQTSIAATNLIFNIVASDPEFNTISILRDEIKRVLEEQGGIWTKAGIASMIRTDSVCRETLRLYSFGNRAIMRKVMVDDLTTEDGILLPKGAMVSLLTHPAQCDEGIYKDPLRFDPFRFSRMREDGLANLSFVSTGSQFLPFGHGKHACPGRFLLDFELKMMVAYLLTNYDLELPEEYKEKRPENTWIAEALMPPSEGMIRVKRRKI